MEQCKTEAKESAFISTLNTRPNVKHLHDIHIKSASNSGYIVAIGCETFIVPNTKHDIRRFMEDVTSLMIDPQRTLEAWHGTKHRLSCAGNMVDPRPQPGPPVEYTQQDTLADSFTQGGDGPG